VYFAYYLKKSKNHNVDIGSWTKFLKLIISLGIPLLLSNLCQTMILTIDRQIISIFYPVEESNVFALYSFAYNLLALVSSMVSAIATVLFPYMKGKDENKLINIFPLMHCSLLIVLAFGCCIYFFMVPIIDWLLPKYNDSLPIFKVLLPGIVISSTISILFHSYYKTFALEKTYFIQSLIVLLAALLTDLGVYYLVIQNYSPNNPISIAVASTVVMFLWYFCSLLYFQKKHPVKHIKNDIFMVVFISAFYIVSIFVTSWWIGFLVYFSFVCVLSCLFYHKEASKLVILIKEKKNE
jgi:O-antigen/teichoic acid export membrane protein